MAEEERWIDPIVIIILIIVGNHQLLPLSSSFLYLLIMSILNVI